MFVSVRSIDFTIFVKLTGERVEQILPKFEAVSKPYRYDFHLSQSSWAILSFSIKKRRDCLSSRSRTNIFSFCFGIHLCQLHVDLNRSLDQLQTQLCPAVDLDIS